MRISGFTLGDFKECTEHVSRELYYGNVIVSPDSGDRQFDRVPQCTARLAVTDSHGPGSRTAAAAHPNTGNRRHGPWACWHAYRDVLAEVFERYPGAVIVSGHVWRVTYRGRDGFNATYPRTAGINVGSPLQPVTMPELCCCDDYGPHAEQSRFRQPGAITGAEVAAVADAHPEWRSPSEALEAAERRLRASARLLGDHIDEYVFGPYNGPGIR